MRRFERSRPRLLVVTQDREVRDDLVTLLTGYGYYVDYVRTRAEGVRIFKQYKHAVVILDVPSLPRFPSRLFNIFQVYKREPIILVAARKEEAGRAYPYLMHGVYDVINVPLRLDYFHVVLRRLVENNRLRGQNEFMRLLIELSILVLPLWIAVVYFVGTHRW